jgi:hypothetical protein
MVERNGKKRDSPTPPGKEFRYASTTPAFPTKQIPKKRCAESLSHQLPCIFKERKTNTVNILYINQLRFIRRLPITQWQLAEVAASQHIINASDGAKIHKYLSREARQQFWQTAR